MTQQKTHLIVVPCHGIWKWMWDTSEVNLGQHAEHWHLVDFQRPGNDHWSFIKHGLLAVQRLLMDHETSVVIFSGSQTKRHAGNISEASSYYMLIYKILCAKTELVEASFEDLEIITIVNDILSKLNAIQLSVEALFVDGYITTEEYALDSLDNLLYSIGRFREFTGFYPKMITISGFLFKKVRFLHHHARVIDFPANGMHYIGSDPNPRQLNQEERKQYFEDLIQSEKKHALELFDEDWYATRSPLVDKKKSRNPFRRNPKYPLPDYLVNRETLCAAGTMSDDMYYHTFVKNNMPWSLS